MTISSIVVLLSPRWALTNINRVIIAEEQVGEVLNVVANQEVELTVRQPVLLVEPYCRVQLLHDLLCGWIVYDVINS